MATNRLQPAFLLHRRAYSNSSLLIECFTPQQGRFPAIARGVKRQKGQGAALLQPFIPLLIGCSGRGEVKTLVEHETVTAPLKLQGRRLYCGFYLNELMMRMTQRNDPQEELFSLYDRTLQQLVDSSDIAPVLRRFEITMLSHLGYSLILDRDVENNHPLQPQRRYYYRIDQGPVPGTSGDPCLVHGATLLALAEEQPLNQLQQREALLLTRHVLRHYLGDRPLKSREMFGKPDTLNQQ